MNEEHHRAAGPVPKRETTSAASPARPSLENPECDAQAGDFLHRPAERTGPRQIDLSAARRFRPVKDKEDKEKNTGLDPEKRSGLGRLRSELQAGGEGAHPYDGSVGFTARMLRELHAVQNTRRQTQDALCQSKAEGPQISAPPAEQSILPQRLSSKAGEKPRRTTRSRITGTETAPVPARSEKSITGPYGVPRVYLTRRVKSLYWAVAAPVILMAAILIFFLFFGIAVTDGSTMGTSVPSHGLAVYLRSDELQYGELLVFEASGQGNPLVRRVVGISGDVVEVTPRGRLYLNGSAYTEKDVLYSGKDVCGDVKFPALVQEDHYFVLSDDRSTLSDSRFSMIGQVPKENVLGKLLWTISFG